MATPAAILETIVKANTAPATRELRQYDSYLRRVDKSSVSTTARTRTLGKATGAVGSRMASAARYAAGAALAYVSIAQAKTAVTTTQDLAKTTAGLNRNLGFTVKEGSRWASVAKSRDIDAKALTMSFTTLSRRVVEAGHAIREGGGAAESAMVPFTRLGLSQRDVLSGSKDLDSFLPKLADSFGKAEGGAKRQASAQQLLGRGYATILPLFADGAEGLKEQQKWADKYGTTLNEKTLKAQMDLVSAQRETKVAWLGIQVTFAKFVTPALEKANDEFQKIAAIMADDKLTSDEKWKQVGEIIMKWATKAKDAFIEILPKLVEAAGKAAPEIAGAFVKGFLNAPILGQLLLGGWLLSKMGGLGAVGKMGTTVGTRFATAFKGAAVLVIGSGLIAGISGALGKRNIPGMGGLEESLNDAGVKIGQQFGLSLGRSTAERFSDIFQDNIRTVLRGGGALSGLSITDAAGVTGPIISREHAAELARQFMDTTSVSLRVAGVSAETRFNEVWDGLAPDEKRLARQINSAVNAANKLAVKTGIDVPARVLEVDPQASAKGLRTLSSNLNLLRSGSLTNMKDIQKVFRDTAKVIRTVLPRGSDEARRAMAENNRATVEAIRKSWDNGAKRTKEGIAHVRQLIRQANLIEGIHPEKFGRGFADMFAEAGRITKGGMDSVLKQLGRMPEGARKEAFRAMNEQLRELKRGGVLSGNEIRDFRSRALAEYEDLRRRGTKSSKGLADGVARNFSSLNAAINSGLENIAQNTNSALKAFGVKQMSFAINDRPNDSFGGHQTHQAGGMIYSVPGYGTGDRVPAMLEPGEVVVNRRAVAAMGGADRVNSINSMIPRFARGGKAGRGSSSMDAMVALTNKYEQAHFPYLWGGGHQGFVNASSPVDCSGFVSDVLHAGGLLDGAPMVSGALASWGQPGTGPLTVYAHSGHTLLSLGGNFAGTSSSNPGGGAGWIEGGLSAGYLSAFQKRTADVTGAVGAMFGAAAEKIKREVLEGPKGPLRDLGQKSLDKVRGAANKYIAKKMPSGTLGGGDAQVSDAVAVSGGVSKPDMRALLKAHGMPNWTGWIAMAESGLDPTAVSSAGARGLFQIMPFWGGGDQLFDPNYNVAKAREILSEQGLSAWEPSRNAGHIPEGWGPHQGQAFARGGIAQAKQANRPSIGGGGGRLPNFYRNYPKFAEWGLRQGEWDQDFGVGVSASNWYHMLDDYADARRIDPQKLRRMHGLSSTQASHFKWINAWENGQMSLQRGGIAQRFAGGGIVRDFLDSWSAAEGGKGDQREALSRARKEVKGLDLPGMVGAELGEKLQKLQDEQLRYEEYASNAAGLAYEDERGNTVEPPFKGHSELEWLGGTFKETGFRGRLQALHEFRNRLAQSLKGADKIRDLIDKLMTQATKRLRDLRRTIRDAEKDRRDLEEAIADATEKKEKSEKAMQARLDRELRKDPKDQNDDLIASLREGIHKKSTEKAALQDALKKLNQKQAARTALKDALALGSGGLLQTLGDQRREISEATTTLTDELTNVQGAGGPLRGTIKDLPPLGELGGYIYDVQSRLTEMGRPDSTTSTDTSEGLQFQIDELARLLREANQRTAVSQAQYGVFAGTPVLGAFAKGGPVGRSGMYLVGERGPEIVGLQQGAEVHSAPESAAMMEAAGATVIVNGDIINTPPGKQAIEVQGAQAIVQKGSRGYGRRPLGSARGY